MKNILHDLRIINRHSTVNRQANKRPRKMYINPEEMKDIAENAGDAAIVLYDHYLQRASRRDSDFSDKAVKRSLTFWSIAKIKRNRLRLKKLGYFSQEVLSNSRTKLLQTTIGKQG